MNDPTASRGLTAEQVKRLLGLEPLEFEGGSYAETWRADEVLPAAALPARYGAPRAFGTAILYLLEPGTISALHRLRTDETYHYHLGDPVEMLVLEPGRAGRVVILGGDLLGGMRVQFTVPRGAWQGSRVIAGGAWSLLGVTVAPGFDRADFEVGRREPLAREWPAHRSLIEALSR